MKDNAAAAFLALNKWPIKAAKDDRCLILLRPTGPSSLTRDLLTAAVKWFLSVWLDSKESEGPFAMPHLGLAAISTAVRVTTQWCPEQEARFKSSY